MFGIATPEIVHSKDGYITYDDYKSVVDPGEGPGTAGPSPLLGTLRYEDGTSYDGYRK